MKQLQLKQRAFLFTDTFNWLLQLHMLSEKQTGLTCFLCRTTAFLSLSASLSYDVSRRRELDLPKNTQTHSLLSLSVMKRRMKRRRRRRCVYSSVEQTLDLVSLCCSGPKNSWRHSHTHIYTHTHTLTHTHKYTQFGEKC